MKAAAEAKNSTGSLASGLKALSPFSRR